MRSETSPQRWQLAQANVARMRFDMDDPRMAGFVDRLDSLNQLADSSPGFVWRYESPEDDETEARVFNDERILFNLSVWESVDDLRHYVYRSDHVDAVRQRTEWFEAYGASPLVLWWVRAGHRPTVVEAKDHFDWLWQHGPSTGAFTFQNPFPSPG